MSSQGRLDAKLLYRRLDSLFGAFDPSRPQRQVLESFLEDCFKALRDDLRLRAGYLYAERRDDFELAKIVGESPGSPAEFVDPQAPALSLVFRHKAYIFGSGAEVSPTQSGILPPGDSAAIIVGRRPSRFVFFFLLGSGWVREELDFALNTIRSALGARLLEERVKGTFLQAAEIQQSLLMDEAPAFPGFEIACRSVPTEEVGGDFFDFHSFDSEILGLSIGDASGHGLPAALLVRDVVTGLRMGLERELKIAHVFEKLNRVINRSNLSSRFVSVFYGELEADGNLVYVNAGHQPPLLFTGEKTLRLEKGGTVIGPMAESRFRRGFLKIQREDVLVACTDGILERRDRRGEFFSEEGVKKVVRKFRRDSAAEILERLFQKAFDFGGGRPWEDDATAVVVRRLKGEGSEPAPPPEATPPPAA